MLNHSGEPNPATSDLEPDRPWRHNDSLVKKLDASWRDGKTNDDATLELIQMFREADSDAASEQCQNLLSKGTAPQSLWDGMFLSAGELLARQPGIVPLHALTTSNAVHYLYETTRDEQLRQKLLLQNAAFITLFRDAAKRRGKLGDVRIDTFAPEKGKSDLGDAPRETILRDISSNPRQAAQDVMTYLHDGGNAQDLIGDARLMVFFKGTNSHDYKFSSAVLEDYYHVSPSWRNRYLAASVYKLRGTGGSDNPLVERTRAALNS